ncbi:DUF3800 domain-containing protein [Candidatus Peregrinibacteria bacterium]|nr:DUF3800 domain-containing protein [Candidatus Peregrinibacteria bacterium]
MSTPQKLYCYVDETGQDTAGEFFLVSIVILDDKREALKEWLQKLEKESGKGQKKWTKATRRQRKAYMEQIVADERFSELIYYSHYTNSRSYVDLTILSTAKAILEKAKEPYDIKVYVDGLQKNERRAFTAGLRRLHVRVDFVRGLTDEADEFIRLCDAIAGFLRDSLESDPDMEKLHHRAMTNHIIKKC